MTIEFADPGYNWAFVWWPIVILLVGIAGVVVLWQFIEDAAAPILIIPMLVMVFGHVGGGMDYGNRVTDSTAVGIADTGFTNVEISGNRIRFSAETATGEYFSGYLLDLRPDSGYAYRIVELED